MGENPRLKRWAEESPNSWRLGPIHWSQGRNGRQFSFDDHVYGDRPNGNGCGHNRAADHKSASAAAAAATRTTDCGHSHRHIGSYLDCGVNFDSWWFHSSETNAGHHNNRGWNYGTAYASCGLEFNFYHCSKHHCTEAEFTANAPIKRSPSQCGHSGRFQS